MQEITMICKPQEHPCSPPDESMYTAKVIWKEAEVILAHKTAAAAYHACWAELFHSPHKHYKVVRHAYYMVMAILWGDGELPNRSEAYAGFAAAVSPLGNEAWSIEEVMCPRLHQGKGIGTLIMKKMMHELKSTSRATRVQLTCKPELVDWYSKFGFKPADKPTN